MNEMLADLNAENLAVDRLLDGVADAAWDRPTPAAGWSVRDQIGHLAFFDDAGTLAITDPDRYQAGIPEVLADPEAYQYNGHLVPGREMAPRELLDWWRQARDGLAKALSTVGPSDRLPWAGSMMAARSFTTARLMETWAHGQDVADGLGVHRETTDAVRHVCHLGVRTMPHAFRTHGLEPPGAPIRVELTLPSGDGWAIGDEDAAERITGTAVDFASIVTQRRHRDDTCVRATGETANRFLDIAQAYAGPPGPGRTATRPPTGTRADT